MEQLRDISFTLDVVLSVPAKSDAEAYEKLNKMRVLKQLQRVIEKHEFSEPENNQKH
jgi:hypothetical protein